MFESDQKHSACNVIQQHSIASNIRVSMFFPPARLLLLLGMGTARLYRSRKENSIHVKHVQGGHKMHSCWDFQVFIYFSQHSQWESVIAIRESKVFFSSSNAVAMLVLVLRSQACISIDEIRHRFAVTAQAFPPSVPIESSIGGCSECKLE